ncbi:MAG: hypothetical protein ROZ09_06070 [Thiobacillus sp.]|jgi:BASS family bile acid:Na+ symporter|uniref:bile acid:sodium symporter family protein n=1 Tax=Thiobacillus sp. TaxID=924 RepID=UPI002893B75D|nr:hypothetical protein [Thiobacillus sp.]MDT3706375.1 hypothetical protein [Thiobacillus sp.]
MNEIIGALNSAFTLAFVITSMFGLGLGQTLRDLLAPLRSGRLVTAALVINFVLLPAAAVLLIRVLPIPSDLAIGLIVMSAVGGAPLAIKASQLAHGDDVVAASLVVLLVLATVAYVPFALPRLVPGIEIDAMAIALPLFLQVLLPLAAGLVVNLRYDEEAEMTRVVMGEIANVSLALMLILNLANVPHVVSLLGSGAIGSALAICLLGLAAGYLLGGPSPAVRRTLAVTSSQRNFAAAFVIAQGSFAAQPDVFLMVLAASLVSMAVTLIAAGEFGRRAGRVATP